MSYALTTIWHERSRYLPAILAVAFSALLIALQSAILLGLLSMMSTPVDRATANVWVGFPGVRSVDLGQPIPLKWTDRLERLPEIERVEPSIMGFALWTKPGIDGKPGTTEACMVLGSRLNPDSISLVEPLRKRPDLLGALAEPGTVVVDSSELDRLGIKGPGEKAEIFGVGVRVVGLVDGLKSLGGPYLFCSLETARRVLPFSRQDAAMYIVGRCHDPEQAEVVVNRLRQYPSMSTFTKDELSLRTRWHWLTTTKAGIALGFTALLGLLVGAVVTSQTLYAATAASQREYSTLRAMGIPRWRIKLTVVAQSLWVGIFGIALAVPITFGLSEAANRMGTQVRMTWWIAGSAIVITLVMALVSGLAALRSVQTVDPAHNLR